MYNTKYECRYYKDNVFLDTDQVSNEVKDYIRSILYKEDLICIFDMNLEEDFEIFNKILSNLYKKICLSEPLKECMKRAASTILTEDEELGLCILYSYDYMYITHECVAEYLETGKLSKENIEKLSRIF